MADLDVQRKKKSPLLWILLTLIILAAIAYFVWDRYGKDNTAPATYDSIDRNGADTLQRQ
ncbi:MAG TPA: hypothetical protein VNA26_03900 [Chitinophagaceae bacterium]|nr:hypothetical protein [Chitinophagaceae bacterium]